MNLPITQPLLQAGKNEWQIFEILENRMKFEDFSEREDELIKLILSGKIDESEKLLKDTFQMSIEEVEIVIESLKFEIKEDI